MLDPGALDTYVAGPAPLADTGPTSGGRGQQEPLGPTPWAPPPHPAPTSRGRRIEAAWPHPPAPPPGYRSRL